MDIVLASNNPHKARELSEIFPEHRLRLPADLGVELSHEETGTTFYENAMGKARALYRLLEQAGHPRSEHAVIADDSGLCVSALGGAPGVYSARYGDDEHGARLSDADRNRLLLRQLQGIEDRDAFYVCCMVCVLHDYRFLAAQETWHGRITHEPSQGTGGFGYDPVFLVPELEETVADLPPETKNRLSHRGKAARVLHASLSEAMEMSRQEP